ncbi:hypothetical protein [Aeromicrobium sp.]|uniref:hypothetical protein n=1 Tax=Aeromicrobium sp. TaxID=1871063 RepID=UPI0040338743
MSTEQAYVGPDGELLIRDSVVLVMDQLGSSAWMRTAFDPDALAARRDLLKNGRDALGHHPRINSVLSYTDNVVLAEPIKKASEPREVGMVITSAAWYQFTLALDGVLCRGAITTGPHHGSPEIVAGPALLDAHDLEQHMAIYPRVLLSTRALSAVCEDGKAYRRLENSPYNEQLVKNADGQVFVNYLSAVSDIDESWSPDEALNQHRARIAENLLDDELGERARSKWAWAAGYHNWFVTRSGYTDSLHVADIPPLDLSPFAGEPTPHDPSAPSPPFPPFDPDGADEA